MDASVLRTIPTQKEESIIADLVSELGLTNVKKISGTDIFIGYDTDGNTYSIQVLQTEGKPSRFDIKSIGLTNRIFGVAGLPDNIHVVESGTTISKFLAVSNLPSDSQLVQEKILNGEFTQADALKIAQFIKSTLRLRVILAATNEGVKDLLQMIPVGIVPHQLKDKNIYRGFQEIYSIGLRNRIDRLKSLKTADTNLVANIANLADSLGSIAERLNISNLGIGGIHGRMIARFLSDDGLVAADLSDISPFYIRFYEAVSVIAFMVVWLGASKEAKMVLDELVKIVDLKDQDILHRFFIPLLCQRILGDLGDALLKPVEGEIYTILNEHNPINLPVNAQETINQTQEFIFGLSNDYQINIES
jgi:hypothetical protein